MKDTNCEETFYTNYFISRASDAVIPARCIWSITVAYGGGCLVKNTYNSKYLYSSGNFVYTSSSTGSNGTSTYDTRVWRIASTTYYGNSSSSTHRELSAYSSFPDYELENRQSRYFYIDEYYSNEMWCSSSTDFLYSVSPTGKVTVSSGKLNAIERGVVTISANHKLKPSWQDIMDTEMLRQSMEIFATSTMKCSKV